MKMKVFLAAVTVGILFLFAGCDVSLNISMDSVKVTQITVSGYPAGDPGGAFGPDVYVELVEKGGSVVLSSQEYIAQDAAGNSLTFTFHEDNTFFDMNKTYEIIVWDEDTFGREFLFDTETFTFGELKYQSFIPFRNSSGESIDLYLTWY